MIAMQAASFGTNQMSKETIMSKKQTVNKTAGRKAETKAKAKTAKSKTKAKTTNDKTKTSATRSVDKPAVGRKEKPAAQANDALAARAPAATTRHTIDPPTTPEAGKKLARPVVATTTTPTTKNTTTTEAKNTTTTEATASTPDTTRPATELAPAIATTTSGADTPATQAGPRSPDPRLPVPGTALQKRDRHGVVRCECIIEDGGIRYSGKVYRSLSSAALAAAQDLGLGGKTQNGFTFWGLSKPPRPPSDPLVALSRAWERYHGQVEAFVKGVTNENRSIVVATIREHAQTIENLRAQVA